MSRHWKQLVNPKYLGCYSLPDGNDMVITIDHVTKEEVVGNKGAKQERIVAYIKGNKPMIINNTNAKTISKMYTPDVDNWAGKQITVYASTAQFQGETVEALRVRTAKPQKPKLTPSSDKWDGAIKALKAGNVKMDQIKSIYDITKKDEEALNEAVQNKG
jgi:hypothetical protein